MPESLEVAPDLITVPEAARRVGINPDSLYRLIRDGKFPPAVRIGTTTIRVSVPKLERMLHGDAPAVVTVTAPDPDAVGRALGTVAS